MHRMLPCRRAIASVMIGRRLFGLVRLIAGTQLGDDLIGSLARLVSPLRRKGNSADAGVSATAIALADLGQVLKVADLPPGIGADGDLVAEAAFAKSDRVNAVRMQIVRDKF